MITSIKAEKLISTFLRGAQQNGFSVDYPGLSTTSNSQKSKLIKVLLFRCLFFHIPSKKLKFGRGFVLSKISCEDIDFAMCLMNESIQQVFLESVIYALHHVRHGEVSK